MFKLLEEMMKEIKIKTWVIWAVVLFITGLLADYFFWHLVLGQRTSDAQSISEFFDAEGTPASEGPVTGAIDNSFISKPSSEDTVENQNPSETNNFLESLKACAPEVAAQAIATPEALIEYLRKSVGIKKEDINIENYHLTLTDGSQRRVHVISSDNSNGSGTKEIRYFQLDGEGYPDRLPLKATDTLEGLLAQGAVVRHEVRSELVLKDGSAVSLEMHDQKIYEFQFNNHGKILSCRFSECRCP